VSWKGLARVGFGLTFVVAAIAVGWQFVQDLMGVWDDPGVVKPPPIVRAWRFFSYFTTQSVLLVVVTSFALARRVDRDGRGWRVVRLDTLTGITITGLVHWFLLHPLDDFHGWKWASDTLTHIVVPILAVSCWLMFGPHRRNSLRVVLAGLIWPLAWLLYTLVVGGITGWYPYFFLDPNQTGAGVVAAYCAAILILWFLVSWVFWLGDRVLPGRQPARQTSTAVSSTQS
jgi:hypothetical protein